LRERLLASRPARIINTASAAHQDATLDFDDLQIGDPRSKLCNILFTRELARWLQGTGVTAHCLHPGFVATRFGDQSGVPIAHVLWLAKFFAISPARGAETIVYLASSPDVPTTTGHYFYKCLSTTPSAAARDDRSALLQWQRSAVLAGRFDPRETLSNSTISIRHFLSFIAPFILDLQRHLDHPPDCFRPRWLVGLLLSPFVDAGCECWRHT
jgi:hypothetical protein